MPKTKGKSDSVKVPYDPALNKASIVTIRCYPADKQMWIAAAKSERLKLAPWAELVLNAESRRVLRRKAVAL